MIDLGELNGRVALSKLKRGQILVRPSVSGTCHLISLLLGIRACCKQIGITLLIEGTCHYMLESRQECIADIHMSSLRACCKTKESCLSVDCHALLSSWQELCSLMLLQVYTSQGSLWFDNKHQTWPLQHIQHLKSLLEDSSIVKVLHDAGAVAAVLLRWEGLAMRNVFDIHVTPSPSPATCHTAPCLQFCCTQFLPARSFSSLAYVQSMTCLVGFLLVVCFCVLFRGSTPSLHPDKFTVGVRFFMHCRLLRVSWTICKACSTATVVSSVAALKTWLPCMDWTSMLVKAQQVLLLLGNILP